MRWKKRILNTLIALEVLLARSVCTWEAQERPRSPGRSRGSKCLGVPRYAGRGGHTQQVTGVKKGDPGPLFSPLDPDSKEHTKSAVRAGSGRSGISLLGRCSVVLFSQPNSLYPVCLRGQDSFPKASGNGVLL